MSAGEVQQLYDIFRGNMAHPYTAMDIKLLIDRMGIQESAAITQIFSALHEKSTDVTFGEFIGVLWNFCTWTEYDIGKKAVLYLSIFKHM